MTSISTKLVKDGNSIAIRLPKTLLTMSGLEGSVKLEAKKGQITIRQDKSHPRESWDEQIKKVLNSKEDTSDDSFNDLDITSSDGLKELPWDGLSYEEWLKRNAKL